MKKNTQKTLLLSVTALIVCCALLAGTTMAWFTDSVSSGVNTITAGNLDIEVLHTNANVTEEKIDNQTNLFRDKDGNEMKWEPGAVAYETFTVKNAGTLALKYNLKLNITDYNAVQGTDHTLKNVLKVKVLTGPDMLSTIDRNTVTSLDWSTVTESLETFQYSNQRLLPSGTTEEKFQVIVYWQPSDADNDWNVNNGKTTTDGRPLFINFGINVVATQLEHENDSFGNTYDQNAVYPALVSRVDSTTSQPVAVDSNSQLVDATSFTDNNAVSNVPASTAMYSEYTDDSNKTAVTPDSNGTLNRVIKTTDTTADSVTYDISYNYKLGDTSTSVVKFGKVVENVISTSRGLNVVKVTHSHNGVETPMTKAENTSDKRDGTYYYDSDVGKIYVWSSEYSTFKVDYTSNFVAAVNGQGYATLEDAIEAAENGDTVILLKNIEASSVIQINKNLTLDLNGFVVTNNVAGDRPFHVGDAVSFDINGTKVGSTMVIPDTNTESYGFIKISAAATVTLNGGSYIGNTNDGALIKVFAPSDDDPAHEIITLNNVTATTNTRVFDMKTGDKLVLNVNGGTYTATADVPNEDSMYSVFGVDCYDLKTPLTFTGVTVNTEGGACVESSGCTATYTDCNFKVNEASNPAFTATAVAVSWEGTANIKSGTYTSAGYGIYVYSSGGTINVENGTISGGTAAACASVSNYENDATINISGGEIIGSLRTDGTGATASISVSGGTFTSDPSKYVGNDKFVVKNGNNYEVSDIPTGTTIPVYPGNIQDFLDGKYGSIDGKTLVLSAGDYGKLELGRATKYPDSNTDYYIGGVSVENQKTFEEFVSIKNSGAWSASAYYVRNMRNVTLKAAEGAAVSVAGMTGTAGHVYGNCYDYVLDKAYTSGSAYYLTQNWQNITMEGITFTAQVDINSSLETTVIDGVTFKNCMFHIGSTASGNQALRYYNENNDGGVKNLTVDSCRFNTCYQGVYTQKINGVTVTNSTFDTTGHNAIAVQSGSEAVNHKAVVITGNTFANIGDRIIRFGSVDAGTQITIQNNTATNSGDSAGEVIKAQSLAAGVTYNISGNNWGEGKTVANSELQDSPT